MSTKKSPFVVKFVEFFLILIGSVIAPSFVLYCVENNGDEEENHPVLVGMLVVWTAIQQVIVWLAAYKFIMYMLEPIEG